MRPTFRVKEGVLTSRKRAAPRDPDPAGAHGRHGETAHMHRRLSYRAISPAEAELSSRTRAVFAAAVPMPECARSCCLRQKRNEADPHRRDIPLCCTSAHPLTPAP